MTVCECAPPMSACKLTNYRTNNQNAAGFSVLHNVVEYYVITVPQRSWLLIAHGHLGVWTLSYCSAG